MKNEHTPGPWTRKEGERFKHDQSAGVRTQNGTYIAAALDLNQTDRDAEVEANARLIAAAPELLQALLTVLDQVDYVAGNCRVNEMVGAVLPEEVITLSRAVISKVKGE